MATKGLSREKRALSPWRTSPWEVERATPVEQSGRAFLPSAVACSCRQWVGPESAYTSNLSRSVKVLDFVQFDGLCKTELRTCIFGYVGEFPYRAVASAADRPNLGHSRPPKSEGRRTHP